MDRVRTADRCFTCFGQSQEADFAGLLQLRHRADRLLDRHGGVDAVLVVHINRIDAEALQRRVTRAPNVFGRPVDAQPRAILSANIAEFRGEYGVTAPIANGAADETLVGEWSVWIRRIKKIDSQIQGAMDRRDRLRIVVLAVEFRHAHAPQAQHGHDGTASAELTHLHDANVFDLRCRSSTAYTQPLTKITPNPIKSCARRVRPSGYRSGNTYSATKSPAYASSPAAALNLF